MSRCRWNWPAIPMPSARAAQELQSVGLGDRLHHYPTQLSGGEQQRVALARALAPDPAILVADEPTGNLDEATGKQIVDLLFTKHAERGMTLVLVTHDTSLAHRCDRVVRLRSGRIDAAAARSARPLHEHRRRTRPRRTAARASLALRYALARIARRPARLLCLHRLHRARRDGDRRRRLGRGQPRRRAGARGPHAARRRRGVFADPARSQAGRTGVSARRAARSRSRPRCAAWRAPATAGWRWSSSRPSTAPIRCSAS